MERYPNTVGNTCKSIPLDLLNEEYRARFARRLRPVSPVAGDSDCIEWQGTINPKGYGQIRLGGVHYYAHRIAYAIRHNQDPKDMLVIHSCHNPACCRPEHLRLGTAADNASDEIKRKRKQEKAA